MCSMKLKHIVFLASAYWVQTTKRYKYIYIRKIETQTSYSFIYLCGDGGGGAVAPRSSFLFKTKANRPLNPFTLCS